MCCSRGDCLMWCATSYPVLPGHADIDQHDIGRLRFDALDRLVAVADGDDSDVLVGKGQLDHALNGHAVVGEKKGLRHLGLIGLRGYPM